MMGKSFFCVCMRKGGVKMTSEEKQAWAVSELQRKQKETGYLPLKSDFDVVTLSRIKAFLGPWPRALEKAGLKEKGPAKSKKTRKRHTEKKE